MKKYLISGLILASLLCGSCYYDVEEEIYPTLACNTSDVTLSGVVEPLLKSKCYKCHDAANNNGNVTLEGYANLKKYVDSGQFLGAIKHSPGFSQMPKNEAMLVDCDIQKIEAWINNGALQN
ncbi:MAG: hypothetical protein GC192_00280 [Bacteroidetes bacterium]|nr:hypothetical protein [Bacteroidota bacterium]